MKSAPKLNLWESLLVGYNVWLLPCAVRFVMNGTTVKRVVYTLVTNFALCVSVLAVIAVVYRLASTRGLTMKIAGVLSLAATLPVIGVYYVIDWWAAHADPTLVETHIEMPTTIGGALATALADSLAISLLLAAIVFLPAAARAHEEHRRELELLHREAELLRIKSHLEPHFVLNSLNAVAGLVEEDPAQARELLAALGDLFREASRFRPTHRVGDELEWLKRYVTIHELRHPDILHPTWDVDEACLDLPCPALILQPLVENAIHHGALRGSGHLAVRARRAGDVLTLSVEDDGPGLGGPREGGQGLSITRRRLELESIAADAFRLAREGDRTIAEVRLEVAS